MAPATRARIVPDGNFRDRETLDFEQCGQETVHALEKFQVGDALAPEGAVTATGVTDVLAGKFVAHPVGDVRRGDADKTIAVPASLDARAAGAVEMFQRGEQFGGVLRTVLQIRVEGDDDFAAGRFHARPKRGGLAAV